MLSLAIGFHLNTPSLCFLQDYLLLEFIKPRPWLVLCFYAKEVGGINCPHDPLHWGVISPSHSL